MTTHPERKTTAPQRMNTSLDQPTLAEASAALRETNLTFAKAHPGESPGRQLVHTVYGGTQLWTHSRASPATRVPGHGCGAGRVRLHVFLLTRPPLI